MFAVFLPDVRRLGHIGDLDVIEIDTADGWGFRWGVDWPMT